MDRRPKSSERLRATGGLARRWLLIVSFGLMAGMVIVLTHWVPRAVRADYTLNGVFSPPVQIGYTYLNDPQAGPVQNTADSRLLTFLRQQDMWPDKSISFVRVRDDGTVTVGGTIGNDAGLPMSFVRMISDGLDGAYVGYTGSFCNDGICGVRIGPSGSILWQGDRVGYSFGIVNASMAIGNDGDLLVAANGDPIGGCANIFRRSNGTQVWANTFNQCNFQGRNVWPGRFLQGGVASDNSGGMILSSRNSQNGISRQVRRIRSNASEAWTASLPDSTRQIRRILTYDDSVYVAYELVAGGELKLFIERFLIADGSKPWAQPVEIDITADLSSLADGVLLMASGDDEISVVTRSLVGNTFVVELSRFDAKSGTVKTPSKVIAAQVPDLTFRQRQTSLGPQGTVFVTWCIGSTEECFVQGVQTDGSLLFAPPSRLSSTKDLASRMGGYARTVGTRVESCIDQVYKTTGVAPYRFQTYCFSVGPTVTEPVCSIDDGANFTFCSDAQIGKTVSHVQVDCEAEGEAPFAEGLLAGETNYHENSVQISGRYVAYARVVPNDVDTYEIFLRDLGLDQLFGTADDGPATRLTNNAFRDVLKNNDRGHLVYLEDHGAGNYTLKLYQSSDGTADPGSLSAGYFGSALSGRHLVYFEKNGNPNQHLFYRDLGPDERLGTGDDSASVQLSSSQPQNSSVDVTDRYAVFATSEARSQIVLVDLVTKAEYRLTNNPAVQAAEPSIDGRYVVWTDFRNDPDGANTIPPPLNNGDIFLYDLGPDETYGTPDDVGERQISTSTKTEYSPEVNDGRIVWTRAINECNGCGWDYNSDLFSLSAGLDGQFGTADDIGPIQLTDEIHAQHGAESSGENIAWVDSRNGFLNEDVYITPVGGAAAAVDEVRFTMTSPSGDEYADQVATIVNGASYALNYPVLIDEAGTWRVSATCLDQAGLSASNETQWNVSPWPFSDSQKLSVYDGVTQISRSSGDTLEIGNAGRDLASTGSIYLRPNGSYAGLSWEGLSGIASQRLHIPLGIDGQPAVLVQGSGTLDSPNGANAVAGFFDGAGKDAGGSAVGGSVLSCGSEGGCAAGRFAGGSEIGLHAESIDASFPAIRAENASGGTPASNVSGRFEGDVNITGNLEGVPVSFPSCTWIDVVQGDTVCPNDGFVAGFDKRDVNQIDRVYCCGN